MELVYLDVDLIKPHDANVRRNLGDLTELAASIQSQGVLQPLVVAPAGEGYVLIAGHRRFAAATQAGLKNVPSVIRTDLDSRAKQIEAMLVENLQRTDLTVMEEAVAYSQLELLGVKPVAIAKSTGRSRATVDSRLRLMTLPETHRARIDDGQLSLADAELLTKYAVDEEVLSLAERFSGSTLSWRIEMLLANREREAKRALIVDVDDDEEFNGESEPNQYDLHRAQMDQQRERERLIKEVSAKVRREFVLRKIKLGSVDFWHGVAQIAAHECLTDSDDIREVFGLPIPGDDDKPIEVEERERAVIASWPIGKVQQFVTLCISEVLESRMYWADQQIRNLRDYCGYEPSSDELELLDEQVGEQ